ncbi:hypothetical protein GG804_27075 [Sphingomonas histidinilytica]|jgi:hypothetical protein|uniref:hypothetical protein n=1 Tax=Rhizorhabdus histidinilytica TaxID=439228 RepID=UPI001ADCB523|nr:hypothetical protein [Rhizorhabdus histidinilytica]MBO9380431.1 hypothetical protein [Rhizorhabdus histidinilytica]
MRIEPRPRAVIHAARDPELLWNFAGLVADGISPADAGIRLGKSAAYGRVLMQRLCKIMGPQAV